MLVQQGMGLEMKLRIYQKKDYKELNCLLKEYQHVLFGAVTGYGKSAIILKLTKKFLKKNKRVLVIAPRRKLVEQLSETCSDYSHSIIMGSDTVIELDVDLTVASSASIVNRIAMLGDIDVIIIDEAHINHSGKIMKTLRDRYWDSATWIGLTATPIDEKGYRLEGYDHTMYNHQAEDLIKLGYLTPIEVYVRKTPKGLDAVSITNGDYNAKELGELMSQGNLVTKVHKVYKKYNKKRLKTLVFAVNITHGKKILDEFLNDGIPADIIHSKMHKDKIKEVLHRYHTGEINVLINVAMLTTGYDEPSVGCLIMARPTKSLRLYLQMVGRAIRLYKGKKKAIMLDLSGVVDNLGHPTKHRNFNKIKPPNQKAEVLLEHKELECPFCKKEFQRMDCRAKLKTTKKYEKTTLFCPHCDEVIDEVVVEYTKAQKMELWVEKDKMTDAKMKAFLDHIRRRMGYATGWTYFRMKEYRKQRKRYLEYYYKLKNDEVKVETIAGYFLKGNKSA